MSPPANPASGYLYTVPHEPTRPEFLDDEDSVFSGGCITVLNPGGFPIAPITPLPVLRRLGGFAMVR